MTTEILSTTVLDSKPLSPVAGSSKVGSLHCTSRYSIPSQCPKQVRPNRSSEQLLTSNDEQFDPEITIVEETDLEDILSISTDEKVVHKTSKWGAIVYWGKALFTLIAGGVRQKQKGQIISTQKLLGKNRTVIGLMAKHVAIVKRYPFKIMLMHLFEVELLYPAVVCMWSRWYPSW